MTFLDHEEGKEWKKRFNQWERSPQQTTIKFPVISQLEQIL